MQWGVEGQDTWANEVVSGWLLQEGAGSVGGWK